MFRIIISSIIAIFILTSQSLACRSPRSLNVPSGFELTQISDAIIVAKILGRYPQTKTNSFPDLQIEIQEVLKGDHLEQISLYGQLGGKIASPEYSITGSIFRESTCSRQTYIKGNTIILFLKKDSKTNTYTKTIYSSARNSEEIKNKKSPWYIAVNKFISIQTKYSKVEQFTALVNWQDELLNQPKSKTNTALLESIHSHLFQPSIYYPTEWLIDAYTRAKIGSPPKYITPKKMIERFSEGYRKRWYTKVDSKYIAKHRLTKAEYLKNILDKIAGGNHPSALPLILKELSDNPDFSITAQIISYLTNHAKLNIALDTFEKSFLQTQAYGSLKEKILFDNIWIKLIQKFRQERISKETALRLFAIELYYTKIYGLRNRDGNLLHILNIIRPINYRTNRDVTLALANEQDKDVLAWAKIQLATKYSGIADRLPVQILTSSIRSSKDPTLTAFLCSTSPRRRFAITSLATKNEYPTRENLTQIARLDNLSEEDRYSLIKAVNLVESRPTLYPNPKIGRLVKHILNGTKPPKPKKSNSYTDLDCNSVKDNPLFIP